MMSTVTCIGIVIPVYRDAYRAIQLVFALYEQQLPPGVDIEIVVVDDGSDDGTAERIEDALKDLAQLVRLPANRGRSTARNTGASHISSERILFMDCDCLPDSNDFIAAHLDAWRGDVVTSIGPVIGDGQGFWNRYQTSASARRAAQHRDGVYFSGSSQNMMVLRTAFEACGGFDTGYRTYGFEDRDVLLRIGQHGRVTWAADAVVRHMDSLNLPAVCTKMSEAGGAASARFSAAHPQAYRRLGYARLDARLHPTVALIGKAFGAVQLPMARFLDPLLAARFVPHACKALMVKILAALSYLAGTAKRVP